MKLYKIKGGKMKKTKRKDVKNIYLEFIEMQRENMHYQENVIHILSALLFVFIVVLIFK